MLHADIKLRARAGQSNNAIKNKLAIALLAPTCCNFNLIFNEHRAATEVREPRAEGKLCHEPRPNPLLSVGSCGQPGRSTLLVFHMVCCAVEFLALNRALVFVDFLEAFELFSLLQSIATSCLILPHLPPSPLSGTQPQANCSTLN